MTTTTIDTNDSTNTVTTITNDTTNTNTTISLDYKQCIQCNILTREEHHHYCYQCGSILVVVSLPITSTYNDLDYNLITMITSYLSSSFIPVMNSSTITTIKKATVSTTTPTTTTPTTTTPTTTPTTTTPSTTTPTTTTPSTTTPTTPTTNTNTTTTTKVQDNKEKSDLYALFSLNKHYHQYKASHYCYHLNSIYSHHYYYNDDDFRSMINTNDKGLQVCLDLRDKVTKTNIIRNTTTTTSTTTKFISYGITGNCITDMNGMGSLNAVTLSGCKSLRDVSGLSSIRNLDLSWCPNIIDVSSLGVVHKLDLSYCNGIADVSALGNVHNLNLSYCKSVIDVSSLVDVHTLNLSL